MVPDEIQTAVNAIAATLDEISHHLPARIAAGAEEQAPATRTHLRLAMETLAARVIEIRPAYLGKTSLAEVENFATFIDSLAVLTRLIERPLDEPPGPPTTDPSSSPVPRLTSDPDPAAVLFAQEVPVTRARVVRGEVGFSRLGYPVIAAESGCAIRGGEPKGVLAMVAGLTVTGRHRLLHQAFYERAGGGVTCEEAGYRVGCNPPGGPVGKLRAQER